MWNTFILIVIALLFVSAVLFQSWWSLLWAILAIVLWSKSGEDKRFLEYVKGQTPVVVSLQILRDIANKRENISKDNSLTELKKEKLLENSSYPSGAYVEVEGEVREVTRTNTEQETAEGPKTYPYVILHLLISSEIEPRLFCCAFGEYCGGEEGLQQGNALVDVDKGSRQKVYGRIDGGSDEDAVVLVECKWINSRQ